MEPALTDTAIAAGGIRGEPGCPWWVLRTRSRQEKALSDQLHARGVSHFLPLVREVRYYGKRKASVTVPLFPGYVFMRGERELAYWADRTGRVAQILEVPDQAGFESELREIEGAISAGFRLQRLDHFPPGSCVEVIAGPLRGTQGRVRRAGPRDRLVLGLSVLGLASELEIEASLLRPVD